MHKYHLLRTVLLSTVFALLAVFLMTPVASAHTATSAQQVATATSQIPAIPNVHIVTRHHRSVFSATTIHCKARGLQKACFTVTNLTQKTQRIIWHGKDLGPISPGAVVGLGTSGPNVTTFTLQANSHAVLFVVAF